MALVSLKEMLADARKNHYAIPAFDVSNYEMVRAVIDVCEEERSPAIFMLLKITCYQTAWCIFILSQMFSDNLS